MTTLKKVIIVARHGPRGPIKLLNKLDQSVWVDIGVNKNKVTTVPLTVLGKEYCKEFGKLLKEQYYDKLNLNTNNVNFYSSKIFRTQESAILVAKEFCDKDLTIDQLNFHESISADPTVRFKYGGLSGFKQFVQSIELDPEHHMLANNLKPLINDHLADIHTNNHFFDIMSTIECYNFEQIELPEIITPTVISNIETCALSYYKNLTKHEHMQALGKDIHEFVLELLANSDNKFTYISTHDSIVFPLSQHINPTYSKLPKFCSHVKYELFDDDLIKVYYDDTEINKFKINQNSATFV